MKVSVNFPRCVIHWSQVIPVESIARSVVTYLWRFFFNWPKTTKTQFTLSLLSMAAKQLTDQCWFCVGLLCNLPKIIHPRSNNEEVYLQHKVCWKILLSSSDCSILKSSLSTYLVVVWISHKRVCLSAHQFLWMRRSIFQASFVMLFCVVLCCKLFYSPLLCGLDIFFHFGSCCFSYKNALQNYFASIAVVDPILTNGQPLGPFPIYGILSCVFWAQTADSSCMDTLWLCKCLYRWSQQEKLSLTIRRWALPIFSL